MFTFLLTSSEAEILLRAMEIAEATGTFPDQAKQGDAVRVAVLRKGIRKAWDDYIDAGWGRPKR